MWDQVDIDNNGFCSFNEFLPLCLDMEEMCTKDHLRSVFALFDGNGSGTVSIEEFK
jgi:Ca2+-binding EF-hand superfamily protein